LSIGRGEQILQSRRRAVVHGDHDAQKTDHFLKLLSLCI
jgi:hypothetical protein